MLGESSCGIDCCEQGSVEKQAKIVVFGAGKKVERMYANDRTALLGSNEELLRLLASALPVFCQDGSVSRKLAYFFCEPGDDAACWKDSFHCAVCSHL